MLQKATPPLPLKERLINFVKLGVETEPHEFDGSIWALAPQDEYAKALGCSVATVRTLIGKPPFVRERRRIDGKNYTLLRIGEKGPDTPRVCAKRLVKIWAKETGRKHTAKEFGILVGLAKAWGVTAAPKLFQFCLQHWPEFMCGVRHTIDTAQALGIEGAETLYKRYYSFPSISVIRHFEMTAPVTYVQHHINASTVPGSKDLSVAPGKLIPGSFQITQCCKDLGLADDYRIPPELW